MCYVASTLQKICHGINNNTTFRKQLLKAIPWDASFSTRVRRGVPPFLRIVTRFRDMNGY
jgi:hypothetical protein